MYTKYEKINNDLMNNLVFRNEEITNNIFDHIFY